MRNWYYIVDDRQYGPIKEDRFYQLVESGGVWPDDLVRSDKMKDWQKATSTPELFVSLRRQATVPRPWTRFWARRVDFAVWTFITLPLVILLNIILIYQRKDTVIIANYFLYLFLTFGWVFIESWCLHYFGTTPGKKVLLIEISPQRESRFSYAKALSRSMKVWWRGYAMGVHIIAILTQLAALEHLKKNGITTWDKDERIVVNHGEVGAVRIVATATILIVRLLLGLVLL